MTDWELWACANPLRKLPNFNSEDYISIAYIKLERVYSGA